MRDTQCGQDYLEGAGNGPCPILSKKLRIETQVGILALLHLERSTSYCQGIVNGKMLLNVQSTICCRQTRYPRNSEVSVRSKVFGSFLRFVAFVSALMMNILFAV